MAYLAIRGSAAVNGVSRLHGAVSRRIFQSLFPRWPETEVPVAHVTNGVHTPTWDSAEADELWTGRAGRPLAGHHEDASSADIRASPTRALAAARRRPKGARRVRPRAAGAPVDRFGHRAGTRRGPTRCFDPDALTLGFARRFATYKRPNLLLHDPDRLLRLLTNRDRPVQLVMAGKAHPADGPGQDMIREWTSSSVAPKCGDTSIFLTDYDMLIAEHLVQGVDVWINTPRRPWEASGTSGMKVLVNGGLNFSELDGWWAEAYAPEVGWALGDGQSTATIPAWDAAEAEALYDAAGARGGARILQPRRAGHSRSHGSPRCARAWRA